ncbi:hypothetical protein evm_014364 [Chilo suppressalis]|nr:hypothetical protein evm_014364 [Chilo suppressalis]
MVNENGSVPALQELETFLSPEEKSKEKIVKTYNMTKDVESAEFDPFTEKKLENPTSAVARGDTLYGNIIPSP